MKLNFDYVKDFISDELISEYVSKASEMAKQLVNKTGLGNDFLGWVNWPNEISQEEIDRINYHASIVRKKYNCLVVIGIGGSYTGAKAAIDMLRKKYADFEIVFLKTFKISSFLSDGPSNTNAKSIVLAFGAACNFATLLVS